MQDESVGNCIMQLSNKFIELELLETLAEHFGRQLRAARDAAHLSQKDLGKLVGADGNTIARAEKGRQIVRWKTFEKLCFVLKKPPAYFFSDERPEPSAHEVIDILCRTLNDSAARETIENVMSTLVLRKK